MFDTRKYGIYQLQPSEKIPSHASARNCYHYTSPEGLKNILSSKTFRFSDCQFLNDKSEYVYFRSPLKEALEQVREHTHGDPFQYVENHITDDFDDIYVSLMKSKKRKKLKLKFFSRRHYVLCASSASDSLNMWNYYTKSGNYQGYNLEIKMKALLDCFRSTQRSYVDMSCGKVIYTKAKQLKILKDLLMKADELLYENNCNGGISIEMQDVMHDEIIGELLSKFAMYRLFFKDPVFSGEKEYRFVLRASLTNDMEKDLVLIPGFEPKNGIITPHFQLLFNEKQIIKSITLSPTLDKVLATTGIKQLLNYYSYDDSINIKQSIIPLRY